MKRIVLVCLLTLALKAAAYCGQESRIELTDGTILKGEIVSIAGGVYEVKSGTIGELKIDASKISRIEPYDAASVVSSAGTASPTDASLKSHMDEYRQTMMSDPEIAGMIAALASDPQIQEILSDPQIVDAARAGDLQTLMKDDKFKSMVDNPKIQDIIKKMKQ